MNTLTVDAIFFDFDGVLVESTGIKTDAFATLFEGHGSEVLALVMAYYHANEGISRLIKIKHCYRTILGQELGEADLAALGERFSNAVEAAVVACPYVAGAREFLEAHAGRLRLFTASGTPEDELRRITAARGMDAWFDRVCGSPATKAEIITQQTAAFGLQADRCVMVGDALSDYRGAAAAGIRFIGRTRPGAEDRFPPATETVADLTNLDRVLSA